MANIVVHTFSGLILLVLFTYSSSQQATVSECAAGFKTRPDGQSCYRVVLQEKNWTDAQETCRGWQAHLASVTSTAEMEFIWDHIINETYYHYWIGLYKNASDTTNMAARDGWRWIDGTTYDTSWMMWRRRQPRSDDTFAIMYMSFTGTTDPYWTGERSGIGRHVFICEHDLEVTTFKSTKTSTLTPITTTLTPTTSTLTPTTQTITSTTQTPTTTHTSTTTPTPSMSTKTAKTTMSTIQTPSTQTRTTTTTSTKSTRSSSSSSSSSSASSTLRTTTTTTIKPKSEETLEETFLMLLTSARPITSFTDTKEDNSSKNMTATSAPYIPGNATKAGDIPNAVKLAIGLGIGLAAISIFLLCLCVCYWSRKKPQPDPIQDDIPLSTSSHTISSSGTTNYTNFDLYEDKSATYEHILL